MKALVLVVLLLAPLAVAVSGAAAQTCTWSGTSTITAPSVTSLRAHRNLLSSPGRVAVDGAGRVYITDPPSGKVVVRDRWGRLGSVVEGLATPLGIAVDATGRIYVGEDGTGRVLVFDQGWNFLRKLGAGDPEFVLPSDIAIDPDAGEIYVVDGGASQVRVYSPDGALSRLFGARGTGAGQFRFPTGIYVGGGEVFVADQRNNRVQVFDRAGTFLRCFGASSTSSAKFGDVAGLAGDSAGRIYVADAFQGLVHVFDRQGFRLGAVGAFGDGPGQLRTPTDVVIDPYNRLFVASANNARVEVYGVDSFSDPHVLAAVIDVKPDTLETRQRGVVAAYIELPDHRPDDIAVATIAANGVAAISSSALIGDYDADGIRDLMVSFDAPAVLATLVPGDAVIVVSGQLTDGTPFEGADAVLVVPSPDQIAAAVDIKPDTLERSSPRRYLTAYIELQDQGYRPEDIDLATITANGVPAIPSTAVIGDYDADGIPDLMVKFDAALLTATLSDGAAVIVVSGKLTDGTRFEGADTVHVR